MNFFHFASISFYSPNHKVMKILRVFVSTYVLLAGKVFFFSSGNYMPVPEVPLNSEVLIKLGFEYNGNLWVHSHEQSFAIKLEPTCFYISLYGYKDLHPYNLTVGELEMQFYKRSRKLLY